MGASTQILNNYVHVGVLREICITLATCNAMQCSLLYCYKRKLHILLFATLLHIKTYVHIETRQSLTFHVMVH